MTDKRKKWWKELGYIENRLKPSVYTIFMILTCALIILAFTGWALWISPIDYVDISDTEEAQELIDYWNESRSFWKFVTLLVLDLAAVIILPLWHRSLFWWKRLDVATSLSVVLFILGGLLTGFGYSYYWPIGLGYTFFEAAMIYIMFNDIVLITHNTIEVESKGDDEAKTLELEENDNFDIDYHAAEN